MTETAPYVHADRHIRAPFPGGSSVAVKFWSDLQGAARAAEVSVKKALRDPPPALPTLLRRCSCGERICGEERGPSALAHELPASEISLHKGRVEREGAIHAGRWLAISRRAPYPGPGQRSQTVVDSVRFVGRSTRHVLRAWPSDGSGV